MKNIVATLLLAFSILTLTQSHANGFIGDFKPTTLTSAETNTNILSSDLSSDFGLCNECALVQFVDSVLPENLLGKPTDHKIISPFEFVSVMLFDLIIETKITQRVFPNTEVKGMSMPIFIKQQTFLI